MADDPLAVDLRILQPNSDGGFTLPTLAATTTVRELRARIQDFIPDHPSTERMRLIYRGKVVANDSDTLADVFGTENIRNSKEQSLHLVLRELPGSSASSASPAPSPVPRSSTAPPNPFRPDPSRTLPQPRANSQQPPHHHHHHHPHHHHPPQFQNAFGRFPIPNALQQHIVQTMNQNLQQPNPQHPLAAGQPPRDGSPVPAEGGQQPPPGADPTAGPRPMSLPPNTTRTIRHETFGPNGERWTMTFNDTNITIPAHPNQQPFLPRPFPHPSAFAAPPRPSGSPVPREAETILALVRAGLQGVRQDLENARALLQPPGGQPVPATQVASAIPPPWRVERIRQHVQNLTQNLDRVQRGLTHVLADPSMAQNRDVVLLQESTNALRAQVEALSGMLYRLRDSIASAQGSSSENASTGSAPALSSSTSIQGASSQSQSQPQGAAQPSLADVGSELFILSSPQGPVGILFDQRGVYTTAPMAPSLPFHSFTQQFSSNRQLIADVGQRIANNAIQFQNQLAAGQAAQGAPDGPPAPQPPNQDQNQNANAENDRVAVIASHLWLIFKLACFVYFFAGGSGWHRPVIMGIGAAIVYLAQVRMFEEQFNVIRRHFEAILPIADMVDPNRNRQPPNAEAQNPAQGRIEPNQNLTPGEAAQRLIQRHQENRLSWLRDAMRTTERAFALFVASLWPGIGERMVQAQEERVRAAAQEAQRLEEAAREEREAREAQEAADAESKVEVKPEDGPSEMSSRKGKERAVVDEGEESS